MKRYFFILIILTLCFSSPAFADSHKDSWKNFYGIAWKGTAEESIKYARQMGYDYVMILSKPVDYKNIPQRLGLKFYICDPENWQGLFEGNNRVIDTRKTYAQAEIDFFNRNMVWKSNKPFPDNLATGWFPGAESGIRTAIAERFVVSWDLQQQRVIDEIIEKIIAGIKTYDEPEIPFTFAGIMYDTADLRGTFWIMKNDGHVAPVLISYWTNSDSGLLHAGITHEYAAYADGKAAFFKKLKLRLKQEFGDREIKWIIEPTQVYSEKSLSDWVYTVKGRPDKEELTPDMFFQEGSGTDFVDNEKIFNSGMRVTKSMMGITQPNDVGEYENRLYAAKAGINGAWYNWFGRFGGSGNMPVFNTVADVYPRLKLIRCIPNWDNLNDVPLKERSWNGEIYQSPKSYISADLIYSRQPKTGKIFVVFNTSKGVVKLNPGEKVVSVQRVDGLFVEAGDGVFDVNISVLGVRLKEDVAIEVDTRNNQIKGNGYIFRGVSPKFSPDFLEGE